MYFNIITPFNQFTKSYDILDRSSNTDQIKREQPLNKTPFDRESNELK